MAIDHDKCSKCIDRKCKCSVYYFASVLMDLLIIGLRAVLTIYTRIYWGFSFSFSRFLSATRCHPLYSLFFLLRLSLRCRRPPYRSFARSFNWEERVINEESCNTYIRTYGVSFFLFCFFSRRKFYFSTPAILLFFFVLDPWDDADRRAIFVGDTMMAALSEDGPHYYTPSLMAAHNLTAVNGQWQMDSHVYGIAIVWFLLSLYVAIVGINLRSAAPCKNLLCRICVLLCLSGVLRAVYLMVEPYERKHRMNQWISRLLYITAMPPLFFSFVFVFFVLLQLSKVKLRFYPLQSGKVLTIIMFVFLILLASFEMLYNHFAVPTMPFYILVLTTFLVWSVAISLAYFRYGFVMLRALSNVPDISSGRTTTKGQEKKLKKFPRLSTSVGKNGIKCSTSVEIAPKIRITDENECTYSYRSENASPALSDNSDHSDSNEDSSDESSSKCTSSTANGGLKVTEKKQMKKKSRRKGGKKSRKKLSSLNPSFSRTMKLRGLVKQSFVPASFCLLQCCWFVYETYNKISPTSIFGKWQWLTLETIFRYVHTQMFLQLQFDIHNRYQSTVW